MNIDNIHNNKNAENLLKICKQCGIQYKVRRPSEYRTSVFCSHKCQVDSTRKQKTAIPCEICGKITFVAPCFVGIRKYCSVKCKCIGTRKIQDSSLRQCNGCKKILPLEEGFYKTNDKYEYRCKECSRQRTHRDFRTPNGRYRSSINIAKTRKLEWNIAKDDYVNLITQQCHYCKESLNETGVGLDRKDNSKGYILNNVVPCCWTCNRTRSDLYTYDEMLILAETIIQIKSARKISQVD